MQLLIEPAGITDGASLRGPPPECGGLGQAVVAAQSLPPGGALTVRSDNVVLRTLTTRQFLGLTRGLLVPFIL